MTRRRDPRSQGRAPRILIINPFGIGDVLFTTPLVRAVRQAFPQSRIGYLCNRRTEPILRSNPHLDELFIYEKDEWRQLNRQSVLVGLRYLGSLLRKVHRAKYDIAIDLSLGERYALMLRWLGVRRRIGFNYRGRGRFLTETLPILGYYMQHVVDSYRGILQFMGIHLGNASLELYPGDVEDRWASGWVRDLGADHQGAQPIIGVVPAGGISWGIDAPFRRWTLSGFAEVCDKMVEGFGASIVLFGERGDMPVCDEVQRLMRHRAINISGQTTLGQFMALLGHMDLVLCNDGGPLHLAVSRGTPTVSIFGPVDPTVYGPYPMDPGCHRIVVNRTLPCRPCYHQFRVPPCPYERACLRDLSPDEVFEACKELLGERLARGARL